MQSTALVYQSAGTLVPAQGVDPELSAAAFGFLSKMSKELAEGKIDLPCFPNVVLRIRKAISDPKTTVDQLVKIISVEPRLAVKLIRTANSAAFNPTPRLTEELRGAIVRIGIPAVHNTAMIFAMNQLKSAQVLRPVVQQVGQLWARSLSVAAISQIVARRTTLSPDEAFLTGILSCIGKLYILVRAARQGETFANSPQFLDTVRAWHGAIGKAVLENWGFSHEIAEAVGEQENGDRVMSTELANLHDVNFEADLADITFVSLWMSKTLDTPNATDLAGRESLAFSRLGIGDTDIKTILMQSAHQLAALRATLGD